MAYADKLKDPRWQRKRLEVLNRDEFKCVYCGDHESTLHVHHIYYIKGREPWDYDEFELMTLCESCHKIEHSDLSNLEKYLIHCIRNRDYLEPDYIRKGMTKLILRCIEDPSVIKDLV